MTDGMLPDRGTTPSIAVSVVVASGSKAMLPDRIVSPEDTVLEAACQAASATQHAMAVLTASVADVRPNDPCHAAAYAAAESLRSIWLEQVAEVCRLSATGARGFRAKSHAIGLLIERERDGAVHGGPAIRIAESLARDILSGL